MRTIHNSSHLLGEGCILPTCPLYWGVSPNRDPPFNQKAITEGHHTRRPYQKAIPEGHNRRSLSTRRPYQKATFNRKATKPEGHTRRPHQKAITEGPPRSRPPWEQTPQTRHPLGAGTPWRPAARHAGIPTAMHAGIAPSPVNRMTDMSKNITGHNFVAAGKNKITDPRVSRSSLVPSDLPLFTELWKSYFVEEKLPSQQKRLLTPNR